MTYVVACSYGLSFRPLGPELAISLALAWHVYAVTSHPPDICAIFSDTIRFRATYLPIRSTVDFGQIRFVFRNDRPKDGLLVVYALHRWRTWDPTTKPSDNEL